MPELKLHLLAIAVHPDDIELGCSGILLKHAKNGDATGILDLTRGELGTRGTPEIRLAEAQEAAALMGVRVRENAGMRDGFFRNDEEHQLQLVRYIRRWKPEIVITNSLEDRHPDHGRAGRLVADACFLAGLRRIETELEGAAQQAWRPKRVFHMIQDRILTPSFIVDISEVYEEKIAAIQAYKSQFHNPDWNEPATYISGQNFLDEIRSRDALFGKRIGVKYAEGLVSENIPGIRDLNALVLPQMP